MAAAATVSELAIVAHRYRDQPAARAALAVLARAEDPHLARDVLHALARRRPDLRPLLRAPRWSRLVAASEARRIHTPELVPIARSLTRSLTLDPSTGGASVRTPSIISARIISTAVHLDLVRSMRTRGWRTTLVSSYALAVDLGMSRARIRRALDHATGWGWLRLQPAHAGAMRPAATPRIRGREQTPLWEANALTEAVLAGEGDPLHDLIASVREPVWSYTPTGHAAYLLAIADTADIDPTTMHITRSTARTARAVLDQIGDPTDADARACFADHTGATAAAIAAAEARDRDLQSRRESIAAARDRTARIRAVLAALPPIPNAADADAADLDTWRADADARVLPRITDDPDMLRTWERETRRAAKRAGWNTANQHLSSGAA